MDPDMGDWSRSSAKVEGTDELLLPDSESNHVSDLPLAAVQPPVPEVESVIEDILLAASTRQMLP